MGKVRPSILDITGNFNGYVIYTSRAHGTIIRRKRGTVKPAVLNSSCQQASINLQKASAYASTINKIFLPYLAGIDSIGLWQRIVSLLTKGKKDNSGMLPDLEALKALKISLSQPLERVILLSHQISVAWKSKKLVVHVTDKTLSQFPRVVKLKHFQLTFAAVFFRTPDDVITQTSADLPVFATGAKNISGKVSFKIPDDATAIMIIGKCCGVVDGEVSSNMKANGISILEVVKRG